MPKQFTGKFNLAIICSIAKGVIVIAIVCRTVIIATLVKAVLAICSFPNLGKKALKFLLVSHE